MNRMVNWIAAGALLGFASLQFSNPMRINPPVKQDFIATMKPPPELAVLFRGACYDCHSNETKWPWYSHVAPVSWLISSDVDQARRRLNFSEWRIEAAVVSRQLERMGNKLESGEMPPRPYALLHASARLGKDQRDEMTSWVALQATNSPLADETAAKIVSTNSAAFIAGRTLFLKNCAHCHGADGHGDEGPDLHQIDWTDEEIATRIRNGKKGQMTAFAGKLNASEIQSVVSYVRSLK